MFDVLRLMSRVAAWPFRGLWWVYGIVYWAFEPEAPKAATPEGSQDAAFEVTDSRPRSRPPAGVLRGGFLGTLAASGGLGLLASSAARSGMVQPATAAVTWAWMSALVLVASTFAVRHVARKREERRERVRRLFAAPVRAAAAAKAACVSAATSTQAANAAKTCRNGAKRGATIAGRGLRCAAAGAGRLFQTLRNPVQTKPPAPSTHAA